MDKKKQIDILLVEDNPADVRLTKIALQDSRGAVNLRVARDGVEAMEFLHGVGKHAGEQMPDLILLDLNLPRKDGREVLVEIKRDSNLRTIPVIILTTSDAQKDIMQTYNMHANCYIIKPMDLDEFMAVMKNLKKFWLNIVKLPGGNLN
jgi:two-component system, chemotaxis family, response regulator Rcp1